MKISREWLQTYFEKPLPSAEDLAHALTFHAFEIESVDSSISLGEGNDILDVKVTPNRGHDCLSYRGIAKEISAILNIPLSSEAQDAWGQREDFTLSMQVNVTVSEPELCVRYIAWGIKGVKVGPSPKWLADRLRAMGQQSINNVVDATNYVMFSVGQPLHAFDAGRLKSHDGAYAIEVRRARNDEKILALDHKEYQLKDSMLVITDANAHVPIGIAGVKGGMPAAISEETVDIIIESANFDGASVRKTAQMLKLRTDASSRFEQQISPELSAYGMRAAAKLIRELAGGELAAFADVYEKQQEKKKVSVSIQKINHVLGTELSKSDIEDVFTRLGFDQSWEGEVVTIEAPFERLDISIAEDLIEEVGRIVGYDKIPSTELPVAEIKQVINQNFAAAESAREELVAQGYSEVFTSVFTQKGERAVANKVDGDTPFLRTTLLDGLKEALERNARNKDLLGLKDVKLFEIGTVWKGGKEISMLATADAKNVTEKILPIGSVKAYAGSSSTETERYQSFSRYPFIVRDIAMWVPEGTIADDVYEVIRAHTGSLAVRIEKFDEFKKGDKISFAFRIVFQSPDRTLFDEDANERMESVYMAVKEKGWEVR